VPGRYLRNLSFSGWRESIKSDEARELAAAVVTTENGAEAVISFLTFYLHFNPDALLVVAATGLQALRATAKLGGSRAGAMDEWADLAKRLAPSAPREITEVVLERLVHTDLVLNDELVEALRAAWKAGDKPQLFNELYGPLIERRDLAGWKLRSELEKFPFEELGTAFLVDWITVSPEVRAQALAQLIGAPSSQVSDLHAELLRLFADHDVGGAFFGDLISGAFMGSAVQRTRGLISRAESWLADERPYVRDWAVNVVRSLTEMVKVEETRESEDRFSR
jgi:hypothetical protein